MVIFRVGQFRQLHDACYKDVANMILLLWFALLLALSGWFILTRRKRD